MDIAPVLEEKNKEKSNPAEDMDIEIEDNKKYNLYQEKKAKKMTQQILLMIIPSHKETKMAKQSDDNSVISVLKDAT